MWCGLTLKGAILKAIEPAGAAHILRNTSIWALGAPLEMGGLPWASYLRTLTSHGRYYRGNLFISNFSRNPTNTLLTDIVSKSFIYFLYVVPIFWIHPLLMFHFFPINDLFSKWNHQEDSNIRDVIVWIFSVKLN